MIVIINIYILILFLQDSEGFIPSADLEGHEQIQHVPLVSLGVYHGVSNIY